MESREINIKELPEEFEGRGEVSGYTFSLVEKTENGYIYRVKSDNSEHFEVFKRVTRAEIVNSETMQLSETDFVVSYPRSTVFGISAWTCSSIEKAKERLLKFTKNIEEVE